MNADFKYVSGCWKASGKSPYLLTFSASADCCTLALDTDLKDAKEQDLEDCLCGAVKVRCYQRL